MKFFSTPHERFAFELGVFVGALLGLVAANVLVELIAVYVSSL